ncbi:pyridoxamine 5'-phosphate oxidase family protein [Thiohalomonas denitrificans]|uniref:Pyridoxamine 5'-phosphate oxidase n=1 Tax=Thiohalomonas denitrificans TaxID=415747 RepID=A0A1G5R3I8_9GAMM|nr:pyridoxamine 5'-phosphate oxidase family protein [Thiohalomonas denitrificans]SCZ68408.1 Pyridoxamine 5'-phosphate oxidase [Thiohalomonas denitrificans]
MSLKKRIQSLLDSQKLAVLATKRDGSPYNNLMAFAASSDLTCFYFVTNRSTRKFKNLSEDDRASLLVDDRENTSSDFHRACAVTVLGRTHPLEGETLSVAKKLLLIRHPYLKNFVDAPTCQVFCFEVEVYYFVEAFGNVSEYRPEP